MHPHDPSEEWPQLQRQTNGIVVANYLERTMLSEFQLN